MNETRKPFVCAKNGCDMAFTNEDHLNVHKKKHDMALHLGIDSQNNTVADQTPTPTRFIRNCEEVGLFQDLQNVNPFDETFRKATELVKSGSLHIPETTSSDDTLHTPHIFPYIEEKEQVNKFSRNNSNEPEFSVTTIDGDFLRLGEKKGLLLSEEGNDSDDTERNNLLKKNDLVINTSNDNTLISKDSLISNITPTAIPVPSLFVNSDIPPVVVNNLSDIQTTNSNGKNVMKKKLCVNNSKKKTSTDGAVKLKLIETINNRIKVEESESDDCDNNMVVFLNDIDINPLFTNNVSSQIIKSPQKNVTAKHSNKESTHNNANSTTGTETVFVTTNTQNKNSVKKTKISVTQNQLERQRELNRAAQVRSRQKKKYCINQMEIEIALLQRDKRELFEENQDLKHEIMLLKTMLTYHKDCPISKDPKIAEKVNATAKTLQEEQQKRILKDQLSKKVVPILPNPRSMYALTPVPSPVFIQIPAQVAQALAISTNTTVGTQVSQSFTLASNVTTSTSAKGTALQIPTLSSVITKPLTSTISPVSNISQVISGQSNSNENSSLNIISKLSDDLNLTSLKCTTTRIQSKMTKAKDKLQRKKGKGITNTKNVIKLSNRVMAPDNDYFIVTKPSK